MRVTGFVFVGLVGDELFSVFLFFLSFFDENQTNKKYNAFNSDCCRNSYQSFPPPATPLGRCINAVDGFERMVKMAVDRLPRGNNNNDDDDEITTTIEMATAKITLTADEMITDANFQTGSVEKKHGDDPCERLGLCLGDNGQNRRVQGVREDDQDEEQGFRVATAAAAAAVGHPAAAETAAVRAQGRLLAQGQGRGQRSGQADGLPEPAPQGLRRRAAVVGTVCGADRRGAQQDRRGRAAHHQNVRTTGERAENVCGRRRRRPDRPTSQADRALRRVAAKVRVQAVRRDQGATVAALRHVREHVEAEQPGARV